MSEKWEDKESKCFGEVRGHCLVGLQGQYAGGQGA